MTCFYEYKDSFYKVGEFIYPYVNPECEHCIKLYECMERHKDNIKKLNVDISKQI